MKTRSLLPRLALVCLGLLASETRAAPTISSQPFAATVSSGNNITLSVRATPLSGSLSFQWRKNTGSVVTGTFLSVVTTVNGDGSTTSALNFSNPQVADAGNYDVIVTDGSGNVTSSTAVVAITDDPPSITGQSEPFLYAPMGGTARLFANVVGSTPFTMQWKRDGVGLDGPYYGTSVSTIDVANLAAGQFGTYTLEISNAYGSTVSQPILVTQTSAAPYHNWSFRNPTPQGNSLNSLTIGSARLVAVGAGGLILTSSDGGNSWQGQSGGIMQALNYVTYDAAKSQYLYGGGFTQIATAPDAPTLTWTTHYPAGANESYPGIATDGSRYVAVGGDFSTKPISAVARISTDGGLTWTTQVHPGVNLALTSVAFGAPKFVAVGPSGTVLNSTDGTSWGAVTFSPSAPTANFNRIVFANGTFVAVGNGGIIYTSTDGATFTQQTNANTNNLFSVARVSGSGGTALWAAVGANATVLTSADNGITWSAALAPGPTTLALNDIQSDGTNVYIVGQAGRILKSTSAASFTAASLTELSFSVQSDYSNTINDVIWDATTSQFVAVAATGNIHTSPDGMSWTRSASLPALGFIGGVARFGSQFLAAANAHIATSSDGQNWTDPGAISGASGFNSIAASASVAVAVGAGGKIFKSSTGTAWTAAASPGSGNTGSVLNRVVYGNGRFMAVGGNNNGGTSIVIRTSTDGDSWTTLNPGTVGQLWGVDYGNGIWMAIGSGTSSGGGAFILRSSDNGTTWQRDNLPGATFAYSLRYLNGAWYFVGSSSVLGVSHDNGDDWEYVPLSARPAVQTMRGVAVGNGYMVIVGNDSTILRSANENNPPSIAVQPPLSQSVVQGSTAMISVTAGQSVSTTYQWRKNGTNISTVSNPSAASPTLVLPNVQAADLANYDVVITNSVASTTSSPARLLQSPASGDTFPNFAWRNPLPAGGTLQTVIFAQSKFVAAGVGGRVLTSTDGSIWTPSLNPMPVESIYGLAYDGTRFIAAGSSGRIFTATDPTGVWTQRASAPQWLNGVTVAGANYVAIGGNGAIYASTDGSNGANWSAATSPTNNQLQAVAGTTGHYVAVGQNGTILHSTNATNWTVVAAPAGYASQQLNGVAFVNNQFVIVGSNGSVLSSPDGTAGTWTAHTNPFGDWLRSVVYDGSKYVVTGDGNAALVSTDLDNWSRYSVPTNTPWNGLAYNGSDTFVAVGGGGEIWTSANAQNWFSHGANGGANRLADLAATPDGGFLTVGSSGTVAFSDDGVQWTRLVTPVSNWMNAVALSDQVSVAVRSCGDIAVTTDGRNWVNRTVGDHVSNNGVVFAQGRFVTVGDNGTFRTSTDGFNWTTSSIAGLTNSLRSVAALGNLFIAVGDQGRIYTSPDGTNWTARVSGTSQNLQRVRVIDGTVFAVGDNRTVLISADGTAWLSVAQSTDYNTFGYSYHDITHLPDGFYIASSQGQFVKSPTLSTTDASTWTRVAQLGFGENLNAIAVSSGKVVVAGDGGTVMESALPAAAAAPAITLAPAAQAASVGGNVLLSVGATGAGPLSYQWQRNGTDVPGATAAVLILANTQTAASGSYTVVVSGPGGAPATSSAVTVSVGAPVIGSSLTASGTAGVPFTYNIGASNSPTGYGASGVPAGLSFNSATGVISGTPSAGVFTVTISATNAGGTDTRNLALFIAAAGSDTFPNFAWRNPLPAGGTLQTVIFAQNQFVAAGVGGRVLTSPGGSVWTPSANPMPVETIYGLAYDGTRFIAVGSSGKIFTSADPTAVWTQRASAPQWFYGVTVVGSKYVAVGGNGTIYTSTDGSNGANWSAATSPTNNSLQAVAGTTGHFVAVGQNGTLLHSTDAATWTIVAAPSGYASTQFNGVVYLNNQFVVVGANGSVLSSPDGTAGSWTAHVTGNGDWLHTVAYDGTNYVVATDGNSVYVSSDLTSWSFHPLPVNTPLFALTYNGVDTFVAVGGGGEIWSSTNTTNWTSRGATGGAYRMIDLTTLPNGNFLAVGSSGLTAVSADGVSWVRSHLPNSNWSNGVAASASVIVAVSGFGDIATSTDGISWLNHPVGDNFSNNGVAYGQNTFVAVGDQGRFRTSSDGSSWNTGSIGGLSSSLRSVAAFGNLFIAVGDLGKIYTSTDGSNWTLRTSGTTLNLQRVRVLDGTAFALGDNRTVLVSTDGTTWLPVAQPTDYNTFGYGYHDITHLPDGYYIASSQGLFIKSPTLSTTDASTWTRVTQLAFGENLNAIAVSGGKVVIAAEGGTLMESALPAAGAAPAITLPPAAQTAFTGSNLLLSVGATGTGPLTYQWKKDGNDIAGATAAVLVLANAQPGATGSYTVVVSGSGGSPATSAGAAVTVNAVVAPVITSLPIAAQVITSGANLSVTATGTGPLAYQWYHGLPGDISSPVSTNPNYTTPALNSSEHYWVRVSNGGGSVDSVATTAYAFTPVNPGNLSNGINGLAYGNSTYVAVANGNTVLTSSDNGVSWTRQIGLNGNSLRGVAFGGGTFVAVGDNGTIRTSTNNGATWTTATSGSNQLSGVIYDGTQFVAVGFNSTVLTSPTGTVWTTQSLGASGVNLQGIAFGGSTLTYVAVGQNGTIYTSTNTTSWNAHTSGTANTLFGAAFGAGKFVAVGNSGTILVSSDAAGSSWSAATSGTTNNLNTVVFGNSLFITGGGSPVSSPDGTTWTNNSFIPANSGSNGSSVNASVYANSQFVMAGFAGAVFTSPTGAVNSWTLRDTLFTTNVNDAIYAGGRLVLAGNSGVIAVFPDGGTPALRSPAVGGVTNALRRLAYGKGLYVAVGDSGRILTSPDGLIWTNRTFGSTNYTAVAYGNGLFVAAGAGGVYVTSPDGLSWTTGAGTIGNAIINAIDYGASVFVAVDSAGGIYTSSTGSGWAAQSSPVGTALNHVVFAGGRFVAVGANSVVLTSPAGTNWTAQNLGTTGIALNKVAYGDGLYLAVHSGPSNSSLIFFSRDGSAWASTSPGGGVVNQFNTTSATYGNGSFIVSGPGGVTVRTLPAADSVYIATQPVATTTVTPGTSATLSVTANGAGLSYQWYSGVSGDTSAPVAGGTSATLVTPVITQSRNFWVRVTGGGTTVDSAASAISGNAAPPSISTPPAASSITAGQTANFSVQASGTGTLTYQWLRSGVPIPTATSVGYSIPGASRTDADYYSVAVSDGFNTTVSAPALLSVAPNSYPQGLQLDPNFAVNIEATGSQNTINKIAFAPNNKFIAAGDFRFVSTTVNSTTASATINRVARFNTDGSLDPTFAPTLVGASPLLAVGAQTIGVNAGKVIIAGPISVVAVGTDTRRLVRLNADGSLDTTFSINGGAGVVGGQVNAVIVQPADDKVVVVGTFTFFNNLTRNRIVRLNADGSLDGSFYADVNGNINAAALQSDGRILIGGSFTVVDNQTRNRLARLNSDGTLDTSFNPAVSGVPAAGADNTVNAIAVTTDGSNKIVIGGSFLNYNNNAVTRLARITSTGAFDAGLAAFNNTVLDLACPTDGTIYVAGSFTTVNNVATVSSVAVARLVRLTSAGAVDTGFNPGATAINGNVNTLAFDATGNTLLAGGSFSSVNNASHATLARFTSTGTLDAAVNPTIRTNATPTAIAALPNGQVLVAGNFTSVGGVPRFNIARFNLSNGSLDGSYNSGATPNTSVAGNINELVIGGDGKATIVGGFTAVGGTSINRIARLKATDGTLDPSFNPGSGANITPTFLIEQPDGKLIFGSATSFTYNGVTRSGLVRVAPDGSLDANFVPPAFNNTVVAAAVQADGKIVVVGSFTQIGTTTENFVARLNASDGSLDTSFSVGSGPNSAPSAVAVQADGHILIGGNFTTFAGSTRTRIARLNSGVNGQTDGSLDAFVPSDGGPSSTVTGFLVQEDGKIVVRGNFSSVTNGTPNSFVAIRYSASGTRDTSLVAEGLGSATGLVVLDDGTMVAIGATFANFSDIRWGVAHFVAGSPIAITQQPQSTTVDAGTANVPLSVGATGTGPITYQWWKDGVQIPGATTSSLNFNPVQFSDGANYSVDVANLFGTISSNVASLTVNTKPIVNAVSPNQTIDPQGMVTIGVDYDDSPEDSVLQWYKDNVLIPGANGDPFTIASVKPGDAGSYHLVLTNSKGTTTSPDIVITVSGKPAIVTPPVSAAVSLGGSTTLTVSASGPGSLSYQWRKNGVALAGQTNPTLVLTNISAGDAAQYDVVVTNASGGTASPAASVVIHSPLLDEGFAPPLLSSPVAGAGVAVLSDGSIVQGNNAGSPTLLRQRTGSLVRYLADGTRDNAFDYKFPADLGTAFAIAALPDGRFLASLAYQRGVGAPPRGRLALFANDGTPDLSFTPYDYDLLTSSAGQIRGILPLFDGSNQFVAVLAAGAFTNLNGTGRAGLARFNANGTLDPNFNVCTMTLNGSSSGVLARPAIDGNGKIVVAGDFGFFNGIAVPGVARLNADGTTDTSFVPWNFTRASGIRGIVIQSTNKIVLGGRFTVDGVVNIPFIRLNLDGSLDRTFNLSTIAQVNGNTVFVNSMAPLANDRFVAAETTLRVCNADGSPDGSFTSPSLINISSSANASFSTVVPVTGGYVAAGVFDLVNFRSQPNLIKLDTAGNVQPFTAETWGAVNLPFTFARTNSGRVLAAVASSQTPTGLADLMPDGSLATTPFSAAFANISSVSSINALPDGRIFAIVTNGTTGGTELRRALADGTPDSALTTIAPPAGPAIDRAFILPDGRPLVYSNSAGAQDIVNGTETVRRLNLDGSVDGGFNAVFPGVAPTVTRDGTNVITFAESLGIEPFTTDSNGSVYLRYRAAGGLVRFERLLANGSADPNFATITVPEITADRGAFTGTFTDPQRPTAGTLSLAFTAARRREFLDAAVQSTGKIIVAGEFSSITINGVTTPAPGLVRLNGDGTLDSTFAMGNGPQWTATPAKNGLVPAVEAMVQQSDGRLLLVGNFEAYDGTAAPGIVRINADGSRDSSYAAPVARRGGGSFWPEMQLQNDGSVLLMGSYVVPGETYARGLVRMLNPVTNIGIPPQSQFILPNIPVVLSVGVTGAGPFSYQWQKNGNPIGSATGPTYSIASPVASDAGSYTVAVTSPAGTFTSAPAILSVPTVPVILDQPTARRVVAGGKVLFRVSASTATGGASLTYKWQKNGTDIGGATASDYTIPSVAAGDAASYSVVVSDGTNNISSQNAVLTVLTPDPVLWQQFTEFAGEQSLERTINDGNGHVYVPWGIYDRNDDMVAGRVMGALVRLNVSDGSLDPTFKLDPRYSRASHVAFQSDGRLIVAVTVGDVDSVIRVDTTGAVDGTFQAPLFARGIRFVTVQPDGNVLVAASELPHVDAPAGALASAAAGVFRLNGANGHLDGGFTTAALGADPGGNLSVFGPPVVDSNNRIYLVGIFGTVNGTARPNFARLASDGTLDSGYANPATLPAGFVSQQARAVVFQSTGKVVIVGGFSYNGRGQSNGDRIMAIRMNTTGVSDGTLDLSYHMPLRSELGYNTSIGVRMRYAMALPNDQLLGVSDRLTRLNADGTVDGTFKSRAFGQESFWVSQDAGGRFYVPDQVSVAGNALTLQLWGNGIARFAADGTPDESFQTGGWGRSAITTSGAVLSDGRVWVAGDFNRMGSANVPGVAQFAAAGGLTGTQVAAPNRSMPYGVVTPAGNDQIFVLLSPSFNSLESSSPVLARVNTDGTPDGNFTPVLPAGYVLGSAMPTAAPGGRVVLAQAFLDPQSVLNGATGDALLRLNADGGRDGNYTPPLSSLAAVDRDGSNNITQIRTAGVSVAQVLADDRVLVVYAGLDGSMHLTRLTATGGVDGGFNAPSFGTVAPQAGFSNIITDPVKGVTDQFNLVSYDPTDLVHAAVQMPDGRVYVGGRFALAGAPRGLVRLNSDGSVDSAFTGAGIAFSKADAGPYVDALAVDAAGRLYVAGRFDSFNGTAVPGLFRLNADGSLDTGWAPGFAVRDVPAAAVRLLVVGTKLYAFGTVAAAADAFEGPYRVVDIPAPPSISTPPVTANVVLGGSASFTVVAGGTGPFTYQWFKNGTAIGGATNASYAINPVIAGDAASYSVAITGPTGTTSTVPVALAISVPPTIATQPVSQAVAQGATFSLSVGVNGTAPFTYQWRLGGTPIPNATNAAYMVAAAQLSDVGNYTVFVSNAVGNATSNAANITVAPTGFSATHAVVGGGYIADGINPGTVTITNTFNYSQELSALNWSVLLPPGFKFVSSVDVGGPTAPQPNDIGTITWLWSNIPPSGSTFTYTLSVPANTTGDQQLAALVEYTISSNSQVVQMLAQPDPLVMSQLLYHNADTNGNWKIEPTELSRVITLYNARYTLPDGSGKIRTGGYMLAAGTVDGFAPDTSQDGSAAVTLTRYHTADTNKNGRIEPSELSRVITLYNARYTVPDGSGKIRTGYYKVATPGTTPDGYAPDPTHEP